MQLQRVYVIKVRDDGMGLVYTINGIPLPNSIFTGTSNIFIISYTATTIIFASTFV